MNQLRIIFVIMELVTLLLPICVYILEFIDDIVVQYEETSTLIRFLLQRKPEIVFKISYHKPQFCPKQ